MARQVNTDAINLNLQKDSHCLSGHKAANNNSDLFSFREDEVKDKIKTVKNNNN